MIQTIVLVLLGVVAVIIAIALTKPPTFSVKRSTRIKAPAATVFALVNDFRAWQAWSPWADLDPAMQQTYSGTASGVGHVYEWTGNKNVGQGRMEITESSAPSRVLLKLDFLAPFEAHNMTEITFAQSGAETEVVWHMYGPNTFIGKVMSVFVSMDRMVGKDFEKGLRQMKAAAERA